MKYICKIATIKDLELKWNDEIEKHPDNHNWIIWKEENITRVND